MPSASGRLSSAGSDFCRRQLHALSFDAKADKLVIRPIIEEIERLQGAGLYPGPLPE